MVHFPQLRMANEHFIGGEQRIDKTFDAFAPAFLDDICSQKYSEGGENQHPQCCAFSLRRQRCRVSRGGGIQFFETRAQVGGVTGRHEVSFLIQYCGVFALLREALFAVELVRHRQEHPGP